MLGSVIPARPDRDWLRAFAIASAVAAAAALAVAAVWGGVHSGLAILVAALVGFAVASIGWRRPRLALGPYRWWNRAARAYARHARFALSAVCYFIVVTAASRLGSSVRMAKSGADGWVARDTLPNEAYASQDASPASAGSPGGMREMLRWSFRSGRWWVAFLVPFMLILEALESAGEDPMPSRIYTLY